MQKKTAQYFFVLVIIVGLSLSAKGIDIQVSVNTCGLFLCTYAVRGAKIYVDGDLEGTTDRTGMAYIDGIPDGSHRIVARKRGYAPDSEVIPGSVESNFVLATFTLKEEEREEPSSSSPESTDRSSRIEVRASRPGGGYRGINVQLSRKGQSSGLVRFTGHTVFEVSPGHYIIRARISEGGDRFVRRTVSIGPGEKKVVVMEVDFPEDANSSQEENTPIKENESTTDSARGRKFFGLPWMYLLAAAILVGVLGYWWYREYNSPRRRQARAGAILNRAGEHFTPWRDRGTEPAEPEVDEEVIDDILELGEGDEE